MVVVVVLLWWRAEAHTAYVVDGIEGTHLVEQCVGQIVGQIVRHAVGRRHCRRHGARTRGIHRVVSI